MIRTNSQTHVCPECGSRKIIQDGGSGEIVCGECGIVVFEADVEIGQEWTAFSFNQIEKRSRTGLPIRFSFHDMGLSTTFRPLDANGIKRFEMYRLKKLHHIYNNSTHEKNLSLAMSELEVLCDRLNLPKMIKEMAAIMYRKIIKKGLVNGRSISLLITASLYIVCRMNQIPRTLKEFSCHSNIDKRQLSQYYKMLLREMDLRVPVSKAKYGVSRIAAVAKLSEKTQRKAIKILGEAERLKITGGRSRMGMAAAALFMASTINGETCTKQLLADASGITEVTVRNNYRVLMKNLRARTLSLSYRG